MTTKMEIPNAYGSKNGMFNTSALKYSCSLYENPKGSLSLTNPEIMNNTPTKILLMFTMYFMFIYLRCFTSTALSAG